MLMNFNEYISGGGNSVDYGKNEYVFRQGFEDDNLYYVRAGILKAYYTSCDGKVSIKSFIRQGDVIGSMESVELGKVCSFSLKTIQPAKLVRISYRSVIEKLKNSHEFSLEMVSYLLKLSQKKEQREFDFLNLDAEARYRKFFDQNADIIGVVSQADIARYLGITPVALSRIKRRL